ncbi:NAD(P)/FAD-dependent oxidoreductase [Kribbella monticola]|uniref:NAD(P)/FAD-dependent oxidoreductase n=1 Tax=Kribbella monticola TaxID=2185285 RepID=UPI001E3C4A2C|nr:geranylgeranyl reductase family protein [Kribbella monticola]
MKLVWDLVVVGAGPAGAATALGALTENPSLSVLLLDRDDFPRDKACGDGIAPHVLDLLASVGVTGLLTDRTPVRRLALRRGDLEVARDMARPAWVVPRKVFDQRLVEAARAAGAHLLRHRVRTIDVRRDAVQVDHLAAAVVVGADGANSVVRRSVGGPKSQAGPVALAIRGYAPTPPQRAARQEIVFGLGRQPSYAWSFDRGDGLSNVGYGEQLLPSRPHPTRRDLLDRLEELLPGAGEGGTDWRGHHLPLSSWSWRPRGGRVLLAGDAAGLINPMTGEGIYYAVATGLLAGLAAGGALRSGDAGTAYRRTAGRLLGRHLRHTALTAQLCRSGHVLDRGIRASAASQEVFDDLVEIGLANGHITPRLVRALL